MIKNTKVNITLSIDTLKNALITPVKFPNNNYDAKVNLIGCIYDQKGLVHTSSLLRRAGNVVQTSENDFIPCISNAKSHITGTSIYGGIIALHFGHCLLETFSRVWYFLQNTQNEIYFLLLPHHKFNSLTDIPVWIQKLFSGFAVNFDRIHFVTEITSFEQLIIPMPGFVIGDYCNPKQAEALATIGKQLTANNIYTNKKIWLSRSKLKKGTIAGEQDFEIALAKEDFVIIHPELLSLDKQIAIFNEAQIITGFVGSAFHTVLLAHKSTAKLIHFSRDNNTRGNKINSNYLICAEAKNFTIEYYKFFIHSSKMLNGFNANTNTMQDLTKVWQVLYEQELVTTKNYFDPDLRLKLQQLDTISKQHYPNLFKEKLTEQGIKKVVVVNQSVRRMHALAKQINIKNYLEIGVANGNTFLNLTLPYKTAVDPKFRFPLDEIRKQHPNDNFQELSSDKFFSTLTANIYYDLVFIDGLRTFEQHYRGLCNVLLHSKSNTIILIDSTKPNDVYSTMRQQHKCYKRRGETGNNNKSWHGDVFKVVFALHDFHPGLNYRTIVGSGNPQTVVWRSNNGWREPKFNSLETISRLSYFDLMDNMNILRLCTEDEAITLCIDEVIKTND